MYANGLGVQREFFQAYLWFTLAAGHAGADDKEMNKAKEGRTFVAARMTPAQIAEAQRRAREWKPIPGQ